MRVFGLAVAGMVALSTPMTGHAAPSGSSMKQVVPAPGSVQVWGGCAWDWHPVLGHWSRCKVDGFHPTACLIMAGGVPMVAGIMPMVGQAATVPRMTGVRFGIPAEAGEAPPVAGVIHNQSPTGLARCYLGQGLSFDVSSRDQEKIPEARRRIALAVCGVLCMRLRLAAICFARGALRL